MEAGGQFDKDVLSVCLIVCMWDCMHMQYAHCIYAGMIVAHS